MLMQRVTDARQRARRACEQRTARSPAVSEAKVRAPSGCVRQWLACLGASLEDLLPLWLAAPSWSSVACPCAVAVRTCVK